MTDTELPMIVWLRGDEDHCADFILDADAVMQTLGIKRSRLTQISGKELRVGRIRRGRYISPVYRQADVDVYLEWTRASASQLKSASVVTEATAGLLEQSERLSAALRSIPEELTSVIRRDLAQTAVSLTTHMHQILEQAHDVSRQHQGAVLGVENRLKSVIATQQEFLTQMMGKMHKQDAQLQQLNQNLTELSALARMQRQDHLEQIQQQKAEQEALTEELAALKSQFALAPKARRRATADSRRIKGVAARPQSIIAKAAPRPPRARAYATAQPTKSRSLSKRIKAKIDSSIDNSLVSSTTASDACLSGAVSRP